MARANLTRGLALALWLLGLSPLPAAFGSIWRAGVSPAALTPSVGGDTDPPGCSETAAETFAPIAPDDPDWKAWAGELAPKTDITADFEESRTFSFRREAVVLRGISRISPQHGLSLEYVGADPRIVIVDRQGLLMRERGRDKPAPRDPRATAVNSALLHILRFDLAALAADFELKGLRAGNNWTLLLAPRTTSLGRAVKQIMVEGAGREVRRIMLQRSERQSVEIRISPRADPPPFTSDELRRFFRGRE